MQIFFHSPRSGAGIAPPRPDTSCCKHSRLHRHGTYTRNKFTIYGFETITVQRWICPGCRSTYSVIPEDMLPYRQVPISLTVKLFEKKLLKIKLLEKKLLDSVPEPPSHPPASKGADQGNEGSQSAHIKAFLSRFICRIQKTITSRIPHLVANMGQLLQPAKPRSLQEFCTAWRNLGDSTNTLVHLADWWNISLLLDYKSLRPSLNATTWPKPS